MGRIEAKTNANIKIDRGLFIKLLKFVLMMKRSKDKHKVRWNNLILSRYISSNFNFYISIFALRKIIIHKNNI